MTIDNLKVQDINITMPQVLPVLPLVDTVMFPDHVTPLVIGREKSLAALRKALDTDRHLILTAQRDSNVIGPGIDDLYEAGTVCTVLRTINSDKGVKALVQGIQIARLGELVQTEPYFAVRIQPAETADCSLDDIKTAEIVFQAKTKLERLISLGREFPRDILIVIENMIDVTKLAHLIAANVGLSTERMQQILELIKPSEKLNSVMHYLEDEIATYHNKGA